MATLVIKNINTKIEGYIDRKVYDDLYKELAYAVLGAEFSDKVTSGAWDGSIHLFNRSQKTFPTGVIGRAIEIFEKHNSIYEIKDLREKPKQEKVFRLKKELRGKPLEIRKYQLIALKKAILYTRGMIQAATGAGKSFIITMILAKLGVPGIVYVNTKDLLYQMLNNLKQYIDTDEDVFGQIGDGIVDPKFFTVALVQTVHNALDVKYPKFDDEDFTVDETELTASRKETIIRCVQNARAVMIDETQFLGSQSFQMVANNSTAAYYKYGLSVGGDSVIHVRSQAGEELITLKELFERTDKIENEFRDIPGYEVRSFNGKEFVWKRIKGILKHELGEKKAFKISWEKGRSITLTEDHSLYKVVENGYRYVNRGKKDLAKVVEVKGDELNINDYLLMEDRLPEPAEPLKEIRLVDYLAGKWRICGPYEEWIKKNVSSKRKYNLLRRAPVPHITLDVFRKEGFSIENAYYAYASCHKYKIPLKIHTTDIDYFIGFYMGDGWTNGNKLVFAVETARVQDFEQRIKILQRTIQFSYEIRQMPGGSVEFQISSKALVDFFRTITNDAKASTKRIPTIVYSFDNNSVRRFIQGMSDSDGHLNIQGNRKRQHYTTISPGLALDLVEIMKRVNVLASIHETPPGPGGTINGRKIVGKHTRYQIQFSDYAFHGDNSGYHGRCDHFDMDGIQGYAAKIKAIEPVHEDYVYDISVDSEDWQSFVANGILVHNSATAFREDNADIMLEAATGKKFFSISASELTKMGYLTKADITMMKVQKAIDPAAEREATYPQIVKAQIVENEESNDLITEIAKISYEEDMLVLILVRQISHGQILLSKLKNVIDFPDAGYIDPDAKKPKPIKAIEFLKGEVNSAKRKRVVQLFFERKIKILIATTLADQGLDIPSLNVLIKAGRGKSRIRTPQRVGRVVRLAEGKKRAFVFDIVDPVRYLKPHAIARKETYELEPEWDLRTIDVSKTSIADFLIKLFHAA